MIKTCPPINHKTVIKPLSPINRGLARPLDQFIDELKKESKGLVDVYIFVEYGNVLIKGYIPMTNDEIRYAEEVKAKEEALKEKRLKSAAKAAIKRKETQQQKDLKQLAFLSAKYPDALVTSDLLR